MVVFMLCFYVLFSSWVNSLWCRWFILLLFCFSCMVSVMFLDVMIDLVLVMMCLVIWFICSIVVCSAGGMVDFG